MLKVYKIKPYVSVDGAPWRRVSCQYYTVANIELTDELILDNVSFQECREYRSENHLRGVHNTEVRSWFKQIKPAMYIDYTGAWDKVVYTHFNTLSYKTEAEEWTDVTLDWIIKNLSADECIQYLKERGMIACPIMK